MAISRNVWQNRGRRRKYGTVCLATVTVPSHVGVRLLPPRISSMDQLISLSYLTVLPSLNPHLDQ
jgi:hypothetical protein